MSDFLEVLQMCPQFFSLLVNVNNFPRNELKIKKKLLHPANSQSQIDYGHLVWGRLSSLTIQATDLSKQVEDIVNFNG